MSNQFVLDIHTHTIASGHAYGTIREMAQSAAGAGLQLLGISEHGPGIPGTTDPFYYSNLKVVPRELYGVSLMHGCEVNVLKGGKLSLTPKFMGYLDYGIIGIHSMCYENEGMKGNTDNLIECMKDDKIFFVSHPDDSKMPLDYERLVEAAKKYHVALEINNSSLHKPEKRLNCVENYKEMLALCMEQRVPVIVSSDAHDPSFVGNFDLAVKLLEEVSFDEELILNTTVKKFKTFIGKK